jgi:hypothetical protein
MERQSLAVRRVKSLVSRRTSGGLDKKGGQGFVQTILYLAVFAALHFLSGLQNKWHIAKAALAVGVVGPVAALPIFVAIAALMLHLLQLAAVFVGLALFAISKWKLFVALKLQAFLAGAAGVVLTPFTAGLIWAEIIFIVLAMFVGALKDWTKGTYLWVSGFLVEILVWIRAKGDRIRAGSPSLGPALAVCWEFPLVTVLPAIGMWDIFSWVERTGHPTLFDHWTKILLCCLYCAIVYRLFLVATGDGRRPFTGLDMPDIIPGP